jgi:hypothetical protein
MYVSANEKAVSLNLHRYNVGAMGGGDGGDGTRRWTELVEVGLALYTLLLCVKTPPDDTAGRVHVNNLTPGSECNPRRRRLGT